MSTRPLEHLKAVSKLYPNAWKRVEYFVSNRGVAFPDWPNWCFLPIGGWHNIVSEAYQVKRVQNPALIPEIGKLAAVGTWRYCQGIYRFDDSLLSALIQTKLTGDLPADVLMRLPEYCLYIETPGMRMDGLPLHGFWVNLMCNKAGRRVLQFLLDQDAGLSPFPLPIENRTLIETIKQVYVETTESNAQLFGLQSPEPDETVSQQAAEDFQRLLSLVLYLCSDEPDIENERESKASPSHPALSKTRKGWKLFPPDRCRVWHVGRDIGETLRRASVSEHGPDGIRPHIRRPHWHGYWTGPRDGNRRFGYKWLPAIMVRGRMDEDINAIG